MALTTVAYQVLKRQGPHHSVLHAAAPVWTTEEQHVLRRLRPGDALQLRSHAHPITLDTALASCSATSVTLRVAATAIDAFRSAVAEWLSHVGDTDGVAAAVSPSTRARLPARPIVTTTQARFSKITHYDNVSYRSFLEARYAAFLKFLDLPFTYETTRCTWNGGRSTYTIDMTITVAGRPVTLLEIKPQRPGVAQYDKCRAMSLAYPEALVVLMYGRFCQGFVADTTRMDYSAARGLVGVAWRGGERLAGDAAWAMQSDGQVGISVFASCSGMIGAVRSPQIAAAFAYANSMKVKRKG